MQILQYPKVSHNHFLPPTQIFENIDTYRITNEQWIIENNLNIELYIGNYQQ
jgi:hypothetical protein